MRRLPPWIWLVLALVLGVAATYMALGWLQGLSHQAEKAQQEKMVPVVVAAKDIEEATTLTPEHLKVEPRPPETIPKDYYRRKEELVGRMTKVRMQAKDLISNDRLAEKGAVPGLPSKVPPHRRAMTVKVDETSGVAGFLNQGDRVDVVVTIKGGRGGSIYLEPISKVVLQNLMVLATGPQLEARTGGKSQVVPTVTLEVSPEEGERLALAVQEGHITLALRSQYDRDIVPTGGMNAPRLLGNLAPPPPPRSVEVLRRLQRDAVSF